MKLLLATALAALSAPVAALAGGPTLTMREVPLHAERALASAVPRFNMVGVHWQGSGSVAYRTRRAGGSWTAWRTSDDDDRVEAGWHLGNLDWAGSATAIRFRMQGTVTRLRAYYVWSPPERLLARRLQIAGSPPIIPRASWNANESIRRAPPAYSDAVHFAVVHHTAGSNDYTAAESAAIVRGIEIYHVEGNGWDDIGYNLLVDKYGQVFEGRYGGVDKPVIGAHAEGFNTGSVGVAVLGDYTTKTLPPAAKTALEQVLAWRLDLAHVDPLSTFQWLSGGNPRFPKGVPVFMRAIAGHRDTGFTDCPGNALYAELPQIAKEVAALGGPKIYAPAVARPGEGQLRFTARLSAAQPWTVTIVNSAGVQVAQGTGSGTAVDWTWDASLAPSDRYSWTIAVPSARSATGTLAAGAALAVQKAAALPAVVAPSDTTTVSFAVTAPANVTVNLVSPTGVVVAALLATQKPAGSQRLAVTLPPGLSNGVYAVVVTATAGSKTATATVPLTVDDLLSGFLVTGSSLSFTLARAPVALAFQVLLGAQVVATPTAQPPVVGQQTLTWDGRLDDGSPAPDGTYTLALTITDDVTTFTRTATLRLDTTAPKITVLSYRNLRFRVSEPATLTLVVGTRRYTRVLKSAATTEFWLKTKPTAYRLTATDVAGNTAVVRYRR
jgi:N-acetylmuramoyl-L-alanine amidase/FlgD Ig-like domain